MFGSLVIFSIVVSHTGSGAERIVVIFLSADDTGSAFPFVFVAAFVVAESSICEERMVAVIAGVLPFSAFIESIVPSAHYIAEEPMYDFCRGFEFFSRDRSFHSDRYSDHVHWFGLRCREESCFVV